MSDLDEQEKRIAEVFGEDEAPEVNQETLSIYLAYLQNNIAPPCHLTGIEDFSWEERYVFGYGSKKEYEQLKKTQPSYTDTFDFLGFDDLIDEDYGIFYGVIHRLDPLTPGNRRGFLSAGVPIVPWSGLGGSMH